MTAGDVFASEAFQKCADFHGHICPGLVIGFQAAKCALEWLQANRAEDEEIIAIVETDACCADAIQVLTGCTFGKGNFFYKDYGKNVFTFASRESGKGVRIAMKPDALDLDKRHQELMDKLRAGTASEAERREFEKCHLQRSNDIMNLDPHKLFNVRSVKVSMPSMARVEPSKPCSRCGEPTMGTKLKQIDGDLICGGCLENA